ncbi:hypothetical protein A1Q2_07818 [Trichosporon asahii var. asahii CBS 8904]|uniref:THUMP domain-containing protein n=1 Tax=Trichosporon asahii var. asahii (strain CBS 8904) TaxID=1220162 RepID=K1VAK9_TRIAC|nr:hypothetical protein A1Q2_07818 [Trichosporon asahii var. asahii CBS 8904]
MARGGKGGNRGKKWHGSKGGPPRGGDGQGVFAGGSSTKYRTQPLPEMYTAPGIAVTTVQGKEITAEREILEALEEAADELYPEEGKEDDEEDGDIEDMLKKELEGMNQKQVQKSTRFLCYIIVLEPLDPSKLVRFILEKAERAQKCSFRFAQRIIPFHAVGRADMEELKEASLKVLPDGFKTDDDRGLKIIKAVADEVTKLNPAHSVDLKNPDRTIIIDTFRDYEKYKKFNPARVAADAAKASDSAANGTEAKDGETIRTKGQINAANRERRAEGLVAAAKAEEEKKEAAASALKRKADELEDGQVPKRQDVESGEVVEDENADLGDDFVEIIKDGRSVKVRKQE